MKVSDMTNAVKEILANCAYRYCHPESCSWGTPQQVIDKQIENGVNVLRRLNAEPGKPRCPEDLGDRLAFMEANYCFCKGADKWKVTCPYHMRFPLPVPPSAPSGEKEKA